MHACVCGGGGQDWPRALTPALLQLAPRHHSGAFLPEGCVPRIESRSVQPRPCRMEHLLCFRTLKRRSSRILSRTGTACSRRSIRLLMLEHHIGLHDLHLGGVVQVLCAELIQGCGGPAGGPGTAGRQREKRRGRR